MLAAGVPTAARLEEPRAPCVVKADGLAAGKGVFVCRTDAELEAALPRARGFGETLVIEELLEGEEVSLFVLTDGERALALPPAQDYKRAYEGDTGPNTGGMGAYSPVSRLAAEDIEEIVESVHHPVLDELAARGSPFIGLLYAGLMLTENGPRVLEFNCRFGDPETQAIVPLLEDDVLALFAAAAAGDLGSASVAAASGCAVTVVLASHGYPESTEVGVPITGIEEAEALGALVFHAGTAQRGDELFSAGGRVLNVTALGETFAAARQRAYEAVDRIHFPGAHFRRDIALKASHVPA
jgi:phosphoribosylamine--glycine ligase